MFEDTCEDTLTTSTLTSALTFNHVLSNSITSCLIKSEI